MEWISVKDRLPKATRPDVNGNITFSDYVLTYLVYEDGFAWITVDTCRVDQGVWLDEVPGEGCKVTHWMPLPKPPIEKACGNCEYFNWDKRDKPCCCCVDGTMFEECEE